MPPKDIITLHPAGSFLRGDDGKEYIFNEGISEINIPPSEEYNKVCEDLFNCLKQEITFTMAAYSKEELDRFIRAAIPNNWRKMHGYPMRRKLHGKNHCR